MAATSHASITRTGASHTGNVRGLVRSLVANSVADRLRADRFGWSKGDPLAIHRAMARVQTWLNYNLVPSAATLQRFWSDHAADMHVLTVHNAAGKQRLARIEQAIQSLQP